MNQIQFTPTTKDQARLRLALMGPAGCGKTWTALAVATTMGKKVAVIDTEHGSAAKYADRFTFSSCRLKTYSPDMYIAAIELAERNGFDVVVIDSLSHAWAGQEGALEMADRETERKKGNKMAAWNAVTPKWNRMIDRILSSPLHVIATLRSKTQWLVETNEQGKAIPRKVGLGPVIREGADFEFDVVGEMNMEHTLIVTKSRCRQLDNAVIENPGRELGETLIGWLRDGVEPSHDESSTPEPETSVDDPTPEIDRLGAAIFGAKWKDRRKGIAKWASGGRTGEISELDYTERNAMLENLQQKLTLTPAKNGRAVTA